MEFWKVSFFFAVSEFKIFFYDQKFNFVYIYDSFILWDFFSLSVANFFLLLLFGHHYDAEIVCLSVCVSFSVFFCNFSISVSIYIEKKWPNNPRACTCVCLMCIQKISHNIWAAIHTHTHTSSILHYLSLSLSPWAWFCTITNNSLLYSSWNFQFFFVLSLLVQRYWQ